jgi:hypothetical protein
MGTMQPKCTQSTCSASASENPNPKDAGVLDPQHKFATGDHCRFAQEPLPSRVVFQVYQTAPTHQEVAGPQRKLSQASIESAASTYLLIAIVKKGFN